MPRPISSSDLEDAIELFNERWIALHQGWRTGEPWRGPVTLGEDAGLKYLTFDNDDQDRFTYDYTERELTILVEGMRLGLELLSEE